MKGKVEESDLLTPKRFRERKFCKKLFNGSLRIRLCTSAYEKDSNVVMKLTCTTLFRINTI